MRRGDEDNRTDDDEEDDRTSRSRGRGRPDDDEDAPDRRRSRRDDNDCDDRGKDVPYPSLLTVAGYIWLGFGVLILINAALTFATIGGGKNIGPASGTCTAVLLVLFGIVFLHVGQQSIYGTAAGTIGNGSGSLVLGLLGGLASIPFFQADQPLLGAIQAASGLGLLTAGIMAIAVSADYAEWRKSQPRTSKSRDRDQDASRRKGRNREDD